MDSAAARRSSDAPPSEKFFRYFQNEVTELQEQMTRLQDHGTSGGERADAVDHCLAGIARLSGEVSDASSFIPAYDQRTYTEAIKALSNKLQEIRSALAPRPKFTFKSAPAFTAKKNASAISLNDAAELANQRRRQVPGYLSSNESSFVSTPVAVSSPRPEQTDDPFSQTTGQAGSVSWQDSGSTNPVMTINGHNAQHLVLPATAGTTTHTATLSNLHRCVVEMSLPTSTGEPLATLALKNISNSLIVCGHVDGPAHLTNVQASIIVVACRQFRMHESRDCKVYLHTTSRPIIEDCSAIGFAPLPARFAKARYEQEINQWQQVDDFKWLRNEPSPNWGLVESTISESVWTNVVSGSSGLGVSDILQSVGIGE